MRIPTLGQGTRHMAKRPERRHDELRALRLGLDLGLSMIDTAEWYADGAAEELVGEAIAGHRDEAFLVDKLLPQHASVRGAIAACEASLERLGTDRIDLYLLHGRRRVPLDETLDAFGVLVEQGKILRWGVSHFDAADMSELMRIDGGRNASANQVPYNLAHRGFEHDLLPACLEVGVDVIACSPLEQGLLARHDVLAEIGLRMDATPAQVALAWVLRQDGMAAVATAVTPQHLRENAEARAMRLADEDLAALDHAFPLPGREVSFTRHDAAEGIHG